MTEVATAAPLLNRLCIFSDMDKPCASMLVHVLDHGDKGYTIQYIRAGRALTKPLPHVEAHRLTPLRSFGLCVARNKPGILVLGHSTAPKTAKYRDGSPRVWQGYMETAVDPAVAKMLAGVLED